MRSISVLLLALFTLVLTACDSQEESTEDSSLLDGILTQPDSEEESLAEEETPHSEGPSYLPEE